MHGQGNNVSITGHRTLQMVALYTDAAGRKRLAVRAMTKA